MVGGCCRKEPFSKGSPPHASGGVRDGDRSILLNAPDTGVDVAGESKEVLFCVPSCRPFCICETSLIIYKKTERCRENQGECQDCSDSPILCRKELESINIRLISN